MCEVILLSQVKLWTRLHKTASL